MAILLFYPRPEPGNDPFTRQAYLDSIKIASLNENIDFLSKELNKKKIEYDTIETIRIVYRERFNTAAAIEVINNKSVDSTCRQLLSDCVDLNEINELAISKLKAINVDNECLISSLYEKNSILENQISLRDQQIDQLIKTHNKQLRKTKIVAAATIIGTVMVAILAK